MVIDTVAIASIIQDLLNMATLEDSLVSSLQSLPVQSGGGNLATAFIID